MSITCHKGQTERELAVEKNSKTEDANDCEACAFSSSYCRDHSGQIKKTDNAEKASPSIKSANNLEDSDE